MSISTEGSGITHEYINDYFNQSDHKQLNAKHIGQLFLPVPVSLKSH